jgi:hypothetical protein
VKRLRNRGRLLENIKLFDVEHQCRTQSVAVRDKSKQELPYRAHCQRQKNRFRNRGNLRAEFRSDGGDTEYEYEKIKSVQGPTKEAGKERITL